VGYNVVQPYKSRSTFRRKLLPPSSGSRSKPSKKPIKASGKLSSVWCLLLVCCLLCLLYDAEDGGSTFPRNIGNLLMDYIASYPKRQYSSWLLSLETISAARNTFWRSSWDASSWCPHSGAATTGTRNGRVQKDRRGSTESTALPSCRVSFTTLARSGARMAKLRNGGTV
jgi:hypothetical protein